MEKWARTGRKTWRKSGKMLHPRGEPDDDDGGGGDDDHRNDDDVNKVSDS